MRYLGGKSRIGKAIAAQVAPRGLWWEPFCGGLNVSRHLAASGHPGIVSDVCAPLIALYQAVRDGWVPPTTVSRDEYDAAKALPDSDPMKAFCGFGVAFGGKWFGGYGPGPSRNYAAESARALAADIEAIAGHAVECLSFFSVSPEASLAPPECIYADPPYAGTTSYSAAASFDHGAFWERCRMWAARGSRVFVSEYKAGDVPAREVWARAVPLAVSGGSRPRAARVERLFRVFASEADARAYGSCAGAI